MSGISISEQLLMTTVKINCVYADGTTGGGTGFLLKLFSEENGDSFLILITNKHVIHNAIRGGFVLPFKIGQFIEPTFGDPYAPRKLPQIRTARRYCARTGIPVRQWPPDPMPPGQR